MGSLTLSLAELSDRLTDPAGAEQLSVTAGVSHLVVPVATAAELELVADAGRARAQTPGSRPRPMLTCVVIAVLDDPLLAARCAFADVVLSEPDSPDGPNALASVIATVEANPMAAVALALLLRYPAASAMGGLAAESATYSTLQSGPEFTRWRTGRTVRESLPSSASNDERVLIDRAGDILRITLARPGRRNAVDAAMRDALVCALDLAIADPRIQVEITGAGPSFCAGGDLDEFGTRPDPAQAHLIRLTRNVGWAVHRIANRTHVRLHGACMGAGIEFPAFAGRVTVAPDTVIGLPEVSMGLIPGAGGTVSITNRIGRQRTAFLGLSGQTIDAETALRWGLADGIAD